MNFIKHASPEAPSKLIGISAVIDLTSLSRASIYRLAKEGVFPKAIALTKRRVAWDSHAIASWIRERSGK